MAVAFRLPDVGEGLHEAEILRWLVAEGDAVAEDQPLVEVQTDKATVELPSPAAGTVARLHAAAGEVVQVGSVLVTIATPGEEGVTAPPAPAAAPAPAEQAATPPATAGASGQDRPQPGIRKGRWAPATPSTRRLGRELGVDVNSLQGTGPGGRVTDDDVRRAAAQDKTGPATTVAAAAAVQAPAELIPPPSPAPTVAGGPDMGDQRIPLRGIRRAIAQRMVRSTTLIPHAVAYDEADVGRLLELRRDLQEEYPEHKLTLLPFFLAAVVRSLARHRALNAVFDEEAQEVVQRGEFNIGIAAATAAGLTVPVIHHADRKSIWELAAASGEVTARARAGQLRPEDVRGGTFTLNNTGAVGALLSVPLINHPEVAILSVHKVQERPVGRNGAIVLRPMVYLAVAFDHRVIDGDVAIAFLNQVIHYVERPHLLLAGSA